MYKDFEINHKMIYKLIRYIEHKDINLFIRYVFLAGFATLVDLGLLYTLTEFLKFWYIYSAIVSYLIAMVINYVLNKYFSFKNKSKKIVSQFGIYTIVAMVGLGLNQLILYSLVEFMKLWYMEAKFISIFSVMFWSFYGHKKLTFNIFK